MPLMRELVLETKKVQRIQESPIGEVHEQIARERRRNAHFAVVL